MADALRFDATCPRCGTTGPFLAVKIEKAVLSKEEQERGERPGFHGFRCLACRRVVDRIRDTKGAGHQWEGGQAKVLPPEVGEGGAGGAGGAGGDAMEGGGGGGGGGGEG